MAQESINVPCRRRRTPRRKLLWDDNKEPAMRGEQRVATLQSFFGIQERVVPDAERLLGRFGGENRTAQGRLVACKLDKADRRS